MNFKLVLTLFLIFSTPSKIIKINIDKIDAERKPPVQKAISDISQKVKCVVFKETKNIDTDTIVFENTDTLPENRIGLWFPDEHKVVIARKAELSIKTPGLTVIQDSLIYKTVIHEIAHTFGMSHLKDYGDSFFVAHITQETEPVISDDDTAILNKLICS